MYWRCKQSVIIGDSLLEKGYGKKLYNFDYFTLHLLSLAIPFSDIRVSMIHRYVQAAPVMGGVVSDDTLLQKGRAYLD